MSNKFTKDEFEDVVEAILDTKLENHECAELIAVIADKYLEKSKEE